MNKGVVSKYDGRLIVETRLFGISFEELSTAQDTSVKTLRRRRQRAEAQIRAAEIPLPL